MRGIKDSTLKLHAVLHPVLSAPQMKDVMTRVFDMFTQQLPECFKQVQPKTTAGKQRYAVHSCPSQWSYQPNVRSVSAS